MNTALYVDSFEDLGDGRFELRTPYAAEVFQVGGRVHMAGFSYRIIAKKNFQKPSILGGKRDCSILTCDDKRREPLAA